MSFKNRIIIVALVITIISSLLFITFDVIAVTPTSQPATVANKIEWPVTPGFETVPAMISTLSNLIFPIVGVLLFIMIIYGGITKLTAAGDAEKEKQAMQILKNAVIGTVIIVLSRIIVDTISALLGAPGL